MYNENLNVTDIITWFYLDSFLLKMEQEGMLNGNLRQKTLGELYKLLNLPHMLF